MQKIILAALMIAPSALGQVGAVREQVVYSELGDCLFNCGDEKPKKPIADPPGFRGLEGIPTTCPICADGTTAIPLFTEGFRKFARWWCPEYDKPKEPECEWVRVKVDAPHSTPPHCKELWDADARRCTENRKVDPMAFCVSRSCDVGLPHESIVRLGLCSDGSVRWRE